MSSPQGDVFMTFVATIPPAVVSTGYYLHWTSVTNTSLATKTLSTLFYCLVLYALPYKYFTSPFRNLPSPPNPSFLRGNGFLPLERPKGATPLKWMKEVPNDGIICFRGLFHMSSALILSTPESLMELLNTRSYDWEKPGPARKFLARVLGEGLINVEGNEHKQQRKNVTPAFSGRYIKDLVPLFWSKALSLADAVQRDAETNNGVVEIAPLASRVTLDIIGSAGIGKDFRTTEGSQHELAHQYALITDPEKGSLALYFLINIIFPQWFIRKLPWKANARVADATIAIRRITKELLAEKANNMEEKTVAQKDIIATLMKSGKFTDDGLTDQLLTFLAAGHETTASAITWASYLLSKHPEIQIRLRKECQDAFGSQDPESITAEIIDSVPYLEAVCNETLRIYPTVPVTARRACRQTRIGDTIIPQGTFAIIVPWAVNRLPALWGPDAEEFNPDRWMGEKGKWGGAISPYAFITFLHGPRSCIGQAFARYEMKALLAVLVMRYSFVMKDPSYVPVPEGAVTIRPDKGMPLIFTAV